MQGANLVFARAYRNARNNHCWVSGIAATTTHSASRSGGGRRTAASSVRPGIKLNVAHLVGVPSVRRRTHRAAFAAKRVLAVHPYPAGVVRIEHDTRFPGSQC